MVRLASSAKDLGLGEHEQEVGGGGHAGRSRSRSRGRRHGLGGRRGCPHPRHPLGGEASLAVGEGGVGVVVHEHGDAPRCGRLPLGRRDGSGGRSRQIAWGGVGWPRGAMGRGDARRRLQGVVRLLQGQVADVVELEGAGADANVLHGACCLLLPDPPPLRGPGGVAGLDPAQPEDARYGLGSVPGQALVDPEGGGGGPSGGEGPDVDEPVVVELPPEGLEVLGVEVPGEDLLGEGRGGVQDQESLAPLDDARVLLRLEHVVQPPHELVEAAGPSGCGTGACRGGWRGLGSGLGQEGLERIKAGACLGLDRSQACWTGGERGGGGGERRNGGGLATTQRRTHPKGQDREPARERQAKLTHVRGGVWGRPPPPP